MLQTPIKVKILTYKVYRISRISKH